MIYGIACVGMLGELGTGPFLAFRLKKDLQHFRRMTMGKMVVMGMRTWESIGSQPLPKRKFLIITHNPENYEPQPRVMFATMEEATDILRQMSVAGDEAWVAGGAEIYSGLAPVIDRWILTHVRAKNPQANKFFDKKVLEGFVPFTFQGLEFDLDSVSGTNVGYKIVKWKKPNDSK